jgi:DNA-binding transcriptional LysR family regulator
MLDWGDLVFFLAVVKEGTLRGAARKLGVAPTTVGRRLEGLERALGSRLFLRSISGFTPTELALSLAASGRELEEVMASIHRRFSPSNEAIKGTVRISTIEPVASEVLGPMLPALLARYASLQIHVKVDSKVLSISGGETDLAIRLIRPKGQRLVMRRIGTHELRLYASRDYVAAVGDVPFESHRLLAYDDSMGSTPEEQWFTRGRSHAIALRTGSTRTLLMATLSGGGVSLLPSVLARRHPALVEVDGPPPPAPRGVYLVTHEDLRSQPAVRTVWDHLIEGFSRL